MKSKLNEIRRALVKAGLHTYASEIDDALKSRRELKKKAIDLAADIRDAMSGSISDKLSSDMVEGAIIDVQAVTDLVIGELNRIEDKLAKGIWDAMEDAGVSEWDEESPDVEDEDELMTVDEDFEEDGEEPIEEEGEEEPVEEDAPEDDEDIDLEDDEDIDLEDDEEEIEEEVEE